MHQVNRSYKLVTLCPIVWKLAIVFQIPLFLSLNAGYVSSASNFAAGAPIPTCTVFIQNSTGAALSVLVDTLWHIEGNGGIDSSEEDTSQSMADSGCTLEEITRAGVKAGSITSDKVSAGGIMDSLMSQNSSYGRRSMSERLSGTVSTSDYNTLSNRLDHLEKDDSNHEQKHDFNERQLHDVINALKEEQDKLLSSIAEMRREFGLSAKVDPIRVHTQTPIPDELSDYEEEKKVSEDIMKQMSDAKAQVVLSRSMFNTLLGK